MAVLSLLILLLLFVSRASEHSLNKKVLCECKRHTAHTAQLSCSCAMVGYPYPVWEGCPILLGEYPILSKGVPLGAIQGYPLEKDLRPETGVSQKGTGTRDWGTLRKDLWLETRVHHWKRPVNGQTDVKTLPSGILWNAGDKNRYSRFCGQTNIRPPRLHIYTTFYQIMRYRFEQMSNELTSTGRFWTFA